MTDKKNIVIKVKYRKPGKAPAAEEFTPKIITEWNVKRILIAVSVLIVVLAVLAYIIINDNDENIPGNSESSASTVEQELALPPENKEIEIKRADIPRQVETKNSPLIKPLKEPIKKNRSTIDIADKKVVKKQFDEKAVKGYSKDRYNVIRAVLSYDINNKEPKGEVPKTVFLNGKKPTSVYYFTELKSMGNNKVYHEWLKDGVTVSKQELAISGNTSRTSSHRLLTNSAKGNWVVRLVDGHGQLLNEKIFKVE